MTTRDGGSTSELARAKINLALHVRGRRADGYHLIESLVVFADCADTITVVAGGGRQPELTVDGPFAPALDAAGGKADNLVTQAAAALIAAAGRREIPPTRLALAKHLPVAAGLGGGSADAAAALRLLDRHWRLGLGAERLAEIGLALGADVPMCLVSRPLIARGIGEEITPVAGLPALPVVLARPPVAVSTAAVFAALEQAARPGLPPLPDRFEGPTALASWLARTRNDLEAAAATVAPAAAAAAEALAGNRDCLFARMSGTGAAAFGIFPSLTAAERAAASLAVTWPQWWVVAATTGGS